LKFIGLDRFEGLRTTGLIGKGDFSDEGSSTSNRR
jgi:hypothetical protein